MADAERWDIEITARRRLFHVDVRALWRYRDLILMFVKRDFVAFYKQTILGPLWYLLQPLLMTAVYTVVFNRIADIPTDGAPPFLFYMTGLVAWQYFATCMTKTSETFIANSALFSKVYFPRLAVPVALLITNLISFLIQFGLLAALLGYYARRGATVQPNALLLILPLLVLQIAALALGVGILVASLTTRYRDLAFVVAFGTQLWLYATPIVYPLSAVPEAWRWLIALNPMTSIVELFRQAVLGVGGVSTAHIASSIAITVAVLFVGLVLFNRIERTSMDTV
jgi:lipopolysaccharide transport system permease protein